VNVTAWLRYGAGALLRQRGRMLVPGEQAPELGAPDQNGRVLRLADLAGRNFVLWFFVKADTPG
jgi:peroxiredoxin